MNGLGEAYAVALHMEGAESLSSGIAAFEPTIGRSLFAALDVGETERAREIRDAAVPFMNFRAEAGAENTLPGAYSVPALKAGLKFAGLNDGPVREPLVELDDEECERAGVLRRPRGVRTRRTVATREVLDTGTGSLLIAVHFDE